mgnify:CR=1 FL=1
MNKIGIIIAREFNERVRKKSFIITTILMPVLMIAMMAAPTLMMIFAKGETKTLLVVDGWDGGILMDVKQFPTRSIEEPDTSRVLRGSHDGFVENLMQNAALLRRRIREIENNKDATAVEQDLMTTLEVCYEFCLRGFHFEPIDIYRSDATKFVVTENGLLPPFTSVRGLGETAALDTVEKRKGKDFTSVEEFSLCCNKLSQTHIDQLRALGAFAGLPETSQLTLF